MSTTTILAEFRQGGVLIDPTSVVLRDAGGTYGVKRRDTGAAVVAAGTAMTRVSLGVYSHQFTDPAASIWYDYVVTAVVDGVTYRQPGSVESADTDYGLLTTLDGWVVPQVGGCPLELVRQQVRKAFQEFCRRTELWRLTLATVTVADQATYTLDIPTGTTLKLLIGLKVNDIDASCETLTGASTSITLTVTPAESDLAIEADVVVIPLVSRTSAPQWMLDRYGAGIAAGARAVLKGMKGNERNPNPWYDPVGAAQDEAEWVHIVGEGRMEAVKRRAGTVLLPIPTLGG